MHTNTTGNDTGAKKKPHFLPKAPAASARRLALRVALLAALAALSLLAASCDYWGEDWYRNGESSTEVTTSTQAEAKNMLSFFVRRKDGQGFEENGVKGVKVVGAGFAFVLSDDGTLVTGEGIMYEFESESQARAYLAEQSQKTGKLGDGDELVLSGNKLYWYRDFIEAGASSPDLLHKVSDLLVEENGVYYQGNFTDVKSDGTGGIAGTWCDDKDFSYVKINFKPDGTGTDGSAPFQWKEATGELFALWEAEGWDMSFFTGYKGRTGTYVLTKYEDSNLFIPDYFYDAGKLYERDFPFIPKPLP